MLHIERRDFGSCFWFSILSSQSPKNNPDPEHRGPHNNPDSPATTSLGEGGSLWPPRVELQLTTVPARVANGRNVGRTSDGWKMVIPLKRKHNLLAWKHNLLFKGCRGVCGCAWRTEQERKPESAYESLLQHGFLLELLAIFFFRTPPFLCSLLLSFPIRSPPPGVIFFL